MNSFVLRKTILFILVILTIGQAKISASNIVEVKPSYTGVEPKTVVRKMTNGRGVNIAWNDGGSLYSSEDINASFDNWQRISLSETTSILFNNADFDSSFFEVRGQGARKPTYERPAGQLHIPDSYDGSEKLPLIVLLHYFSVPGIGEPPPFEGGLKRNLPFEEFVDSKEFLLYTPHASFHPGAIRGAGWVWNSTEECCVFDKQGRMLIDDVGHISAGMDMVIDNYNVDMDRIYTIGGANGGGMAAVMAVRDSRIAGYVGINPFSWNLDDDYIPTHPVHAILIHTRGNFDKTLEGGVSFRGFRSNGDPISFTTDPARIELRKWAEQFDTNPKGRLGIERSVFDLDLTVSGIDTVRFYWDSETSPAVYELWEIADGDLWLSLRDKSGELATQFPAVVIDKALSLTRVP